MRGELPGRGEVDNGGCWRHLRVAGVRESLGRGRAEDAVVSVEQWSENIILAELGDDPHLTDDLVQVIDQCTQDPRQDVLLNLARVSYLNSSNIAKLLKLRKLVTIANQRRLVLACVSTRVWGVFLVTGLDRIFEFVDNVPSGLAALQIGK